MARARRLCAVPLGGVCAVTPLTAFSLAIWRKGGARGDFAWEPVRVRSARTQHLPVKLRGRPCSITTTLPCVPEGGSFFAAAIRVGEGAPSETIERYAFPRVRRACAYDVGSRKALIWGGFSHALVSRGENDAFWGSSRAVLGALSYDLYLFVCPGALRASYSKLMEV